MPAGGIEQDDIGALLAAREERVIDAVGLGNDLHVWLRSHEQGQSPAHECLIVCGHDADAFAHRPSSFVGMAALTANPLPVIGPARTVPPFKPAPSRAVP